MLWLNSGDDLRKTAYGTDNQHISAPEAYTLNAHIAF